jgi:hypothetical protein
VVGEGTPAHGGQGLGDGVGGDEQAAVEGGVVVVAIVQLSDEDVRVGEDGVEGDGLGESTYRW